jgi:hypothetical protein
MLKGKVKEIGIFDAGAVKTSIGPIVLAKQTKNCNA